MNRLAAVVLGLAAAMTTSSGWAGNSGKHDGHNHITPQGAPLQFAGTELEPNRAVFRVSGIVCSFCAAGVTKKLGKVDGVDTSQFTKGIRVEIENQRVIAAITSAEDFSLKDAYRAIRKGGYEPLSSAVVDGRGNVSYFDAEGHACNAAC